MARRRAGGVPVAVASVPVLALRLALWGGERTLAQALAELVLWLAVLALATRRIEARAAAELRGYLRLGGPGATPAAAGMSGTLAAREGTFAARGGARGVLMAVLFVAPR